MKLFVALCLCGVFFLALAAAAPVSEDSYRRVADSLMCQCGCGQTVFGCNHFQCSSAETLRKEVREALAATNNDEKRTVEILVQKWGVKLLAEPPKSGFHLTAWIMPFAALLAGVFVIALVLKRWKRRTAATAPTVDPRMLERYQAGIDEELEKG